jgi:hypothetical protein
VRIGLNRVRKDLFRSRGGGFLFDAFLIVVVCVGALVLWLTRDQWIGRLPKWPLILKSLPGMPTLSIPQQTMVDLSRESAVAHARFRAFLSQSGVGEEHILKNYNEERREGGVAWIESTIEMTRPASFRSGPFLERVVRFLPKSGLSLMRDETVRGLWTMEFGDRDHVFQRLVIQEG